MLWGSCPLIHPNELPNTVSGDATSGPKQLTLLPDLTICSRQCAGSCNPAAGLVQLRHPGSLPGASAVGMAMQSVPERRETFPGVNSKARAADKVCLPVGSLQCVHSIAVLHLVTWMVAQTTPEDQYETVDTNQRKG
jgi:hypothetical protein